MSVWGLNLPLAQHETDVPNNYRSLEPIPWFQTFITMD